MIDDEDIVRRVARVALERLGYKVLLAGNGLEAIDILQDHAREIAIATVDLMMPVMGGNETVVKLKAIRPDLPVILSSGFSEREAMHKLADISLAGFLQKPYTSAALVTKVRQALETESAGGMGFSGRAGLMKYLGTIQP